MNRLLASFVSFLAAASGASAATSHLGPFRPVAPEEGARAIWVNPAGIGTPKRPTSVVEFVWNDVDASQEGGPVVPGDESGSIDPALGPEGLRFFNFSAGTDRSALGFQWEYDDVDGIADWTLAWGKPIPLRGGIRLGTTLEWRGGEDGSFDFTAGSLVPLGDQLRAAFVVREALEAKVDGIDPTRTWQGGVSFRSEKLLGRVTYDLVYPEGSGGDAEHWLGVAIDRGNRFRLSYALNDTGDWSGSADLVHRNVTIGGGVTDRGGYRRIFAALEFLPPPPRGRRGFK